MKQLNVALLSLGLLLGGCSSAVFAKDTVDAKKADTKVVEVAKTDKPKAAKEKKPVEGVTKVSGALSHRFWVKTSNENSKGVNSERRNFVDRLSLNLDQTKGKWSWKLSVQTINSMNWTSSLVELGRGNAPGADTKVLSYKDFGLVNAYAEYREKGCWSGRFGRTQHPYLKNKSEMHFDNDVFFDGVYLTKTIPGLGPKWNFHGGAYQIYRDLARRDDRMYQIGILGTPTHGKTKFEWRLDYMSFDIDHLSSGALSTWQQQTRVATHAYAPSYHVVNAYGAVDFPNQVRLTLDVSRNVSANAPVGMSKGGDGLNATLVLGEMKKIGNLQSIFQYIKVGAQAVIPNFAPYFKRLNMQGFQWDIKFKISTKADIQFMVMDWKRIEDVIPTDKRYRRVELMLNHRF